MASVGPRSFKITEFRIESELAHGRFAKVLRAVHVPTGVTYALKCLRQEDVRRDQQFAAVAIEQLIVSKLLCSADSHPRLISAAGTTKDAECVYFVLELAPGGDVAAAVEAAARHASTRPSFASGLERDRGRRWVRETLEGLAFLHGRGIVHRDVKPQNLVLGDDDSVRICDFGSAKVLSGALADAAREAEATHLKLCRRALFTGTLGYIAPEQVRSSDVTPAIDLWAVGCVLHFFVCGFPPFCDATDGLSEFALMRRVVTDELVLPPALCGEDSCAGALVSSLLAKEPADRLDVERALAHAFLS